MVKAYSSGTNRKAAYESKCSEEKSPPVRACGFESHTPHQIMKPKKTTSPRNPLVVAMNKRHSKAGKMRSKKDKQRHSGKNRQRELLKEAE